VQAFEVRVAEDQPVVGVPQHKGFRDGLDGVAQPQVSLDGSLRKALLFGDVDCDANQVAAAAVLALAEFAANAKPDPVPVGVAHPECLVDMIEFAGDELVGNVEQVDIFGFHQRIDVAESQQVAAAFQSEQFEHRL